MIEKWREEFYNLNSSNITRSEFDVAEAETKSLHWKFHFEKTLLSLSKYFSRSFRANITESGNGSLASVKVLDSKARTPHYGG